MAEVATERQDSMSANLVALYREKLKDVVATFGAPIIRTSAEGSYVAGVAYAKIGDFGVGHSSLLFVYLAHTMPDSVPIEGVARAYAMEIWDGGDDAEAESALRRVHSGSIRMCKQGDVLADVRLAGLNDRWWIAERRSRDDGSFEISYFGFDESGAFGEAGKSLEINQADLVRVPIASLDESGYGIEVELSQSDNELWQIGASKPAVNLDEWTIKSGWYATVLPLTGYTPAYENASACYVSKMSFDDGTIEASGTFEYARQLEELYERGRAREIVGPAEWVFGLSDSVEFQLRGGMSGPRIVDENGFREALRNEGMGLYLEVVDGLVVLAAISS